MNFRGFYFQRLSGNSEGAPFRGPAGLRNGVQGTLFRRFALPRNARSNPSSYFPDSLWKWNSQKFALTEFLEVRIAPVQHR